MPGNMPSWGGGFHRHEPGGSGCGNAGAFGLYRGRPGGSVRHGGDPGRAPGSVQRAGDAAHGRRAKPVSGGDDLWVDCSCGRTCLFCLGDLLLRERQAALMGYIHANWVFLLLFGLLALFAALDFNTFWTNFHRVFFTNDLWLLDSAHGYFNSNGARPVFLLTWSCASLLPVGTLALLLLGAWLARRLRKTKKENGNAV